MTTKLIKGTKYDTDTLTLTGWTGPHEGLSCWDYFTRDGEYKGADDDGVEPLFAGEPTAEVRRASTKMTYETKLDLCSRRVFLDGIPAKISGAKNQFATVSNGVASVEFAWATVARVVAKGGFFSL